MHTQTQHTHSHKHTHTHMYTHTSTHTHTYTHTDTQRYICRALFAVMEQKQWTPRTFWQRMSSWTTGDPPYGYIHLCRPVLMGISVVYSAAIRDSCSSFRIESLTFCVACYYTSLLYQRNLPTKHIHCCSGTLRTGTSSCVRAAQYHTNAIAVNDFTIATRKWAKLYKLRVRRSVTHSENVILLPCRMEAC